MKFSSIPYKCIPQEGLKLLACITMLIDHIAAVLFPSAVMRVVGRLSFPIYCFLLAKGVVHTRRPGRYLLRMGICAVLSEIPYDLAFYGALTLTSQSVMLTLFLGLCMGLLMQKLKSWPLKLLIAVPFALLAELVNASYGGWGIAMVGLFVLIEAQSWKYLLLTAALLIINWGIPSALLRFNGILIPMQLFATAAIVPIAMYSGKKLTNSKVVQWGFYLFYPVHLLILWLLSCTMG